jgi:hypothetical protein
MAAVTQAQVDAREVPPLPDAVTEELEVEVARGIRLAVAEEPQSRRFHLVMVRLAA